MGVVQRLREQPQKKFTARWRSRRRDLRATAPSLRPLRLCGEFLKVDAQPEAAHLIIERGGGFLKV
jgi:hypothetical protein